MFSTSLEQPARRNTRVLRQLDAPEIEALKRRPGKDIMLFRSASVASQLLAHGPVDELRQVISPVLLGRGNLLIQADLARAALVREEA